MVAWMGKSMRCVDEWPDKWINKMILFLVRTRNTHTRTHARTHTRTHASTRPYLVQAHLDQLIFLAQVVALVDEERVLGQSQFSLRLQPAVLHLEGMLERGRGALHVSALAQCLR